MKIKFELYQSFLSRANFYTHFERTASNLSGFATLKFIDGKYVFDYDGPRSQFLNYGEVMISILKEYHIKPIHYFEDHPAFQNTAWHMNLYQHYKNTGKLKHLIEMKQNGTLMEYLPGIRFMRDFKCIKSNLECIDKILNGVSMKALLAEFTDAEIAYSQKVIEGFGLTRSFLRPYREPHEFASFQYFQKKRFFHHEAYA